ncbi:MAG: class I SAM-dependent methyltransferase [Solirubrobacterales bacterium]
MEAGAAAEQKLSVAAENEEATEAWTGVLFDRFTEFRDLVTAGLGNHGDAAMSLHPPKTGDQVLDLGCGFGDTTQRLAELVGPEGEVVGIDVSERFVEQAQKEAKEARAERVSFISGDVQVADLGEGYDYVFSRMGLMFFANPVAALRNVRGSMNPGGRFCAVVWRRKLDNEWVFRAETVVEKYLEEPEETDEPTCGPGPFSMANADTVSEQLQIAGFAQPTLTRSDIPIKIGNDLDHAVAFNMALGPAGELIRLVGDEADEIRPKLEREIGEALADFDGPEGVLAPASTWIISATVPDGPGA